MNFSFEARDEERKSAGTARQKVRNAWFEKLRRLDWGYVKKQVDEWGTYDLGAIKTFLEIAEDKENSREVFKNETGGVGPVIVNLMAEVGLLADVSVHELSGQLFATKLLQPPLMESV